MKIYRIRKFDRDRSDWYWDISNYWLAFWLFIILIIFISIKFNQSNPCKYTKGETLSPNCTPQDKNCCVN